MTFPQDHRGEVQKAPDLKRFFCHKGHAVGARISAGSMFLLLSLRMGSSKAAVLCLAALSTAYKFLGFVLNWPNFKKLAVSSQHCTGFSCLTWEGVISMEKGYILLSRYFCDVNETLCSGQIHKNWCLLGYWSSLELVKKTVGGKNVAF